MSASAIFCPPMRPSYFPSSTEDSAMYSPSSSSFDYLDMSGYSSSYPDSELSFPHSPLDYTSVASVPSPLALFDWGFAQTFLDGLMTSTMSPSDPSFINSGGFSPVCSYGRMSPVQDTHVQWSSGSCGGSSSSSTGFEEETTALHHTLDPNEVPRAASPNNICAPSRPAKPFPCTNCGKAFTRFADLKRHHSSVHFPIPQDCPVEHCLRKGNNGFPRRDHLMEHLRSYHHIDLPKRAGTAKKGGGGAGVVAKTEGGLEFTVYHG